MNRVRVRIGVSEPVVGAMTPAPEANRALEGAGATKAEEDLERQGCRVGAVRPEAVVSCSDSYAGPEVQQDGKDQGWSRQRRVVCIVGGDDRNEDEEGRLEPVNMKIPVGERPWQVRDVWSATRQVARLLPRLCEGLVGGRYQRRRPRCRCCHRRRCRGLLRHDRASEVRLG